MPQSFYLRGLVVKPYCARRNYYYKTLLLKISVKLKPAHELMQLIPITVVRMRDESIIHITPYSFIAVLSFFSSLGFIKSISLPL